MSALTLTDFLLARLAEDEAVANAAALADDGGERWWAVKDRHRDDESEPLALVKGENPLDDQPGQDPTYALAATHICYGDEPDHLIHIARHDPARVLADVEAKRRIVERCVKDLAVTDERDIDSITRSFNAGAAYQAHNTLLDLAQPYADHDQFREEWRNA